MKRSNTIRDPSLIVEFIGVPGAGKTTIARGVISDLNSLGYKCLTRDIWGDRSSAKYKKSRHSTKELYHFITFSASYKHVAFRALWYGIRVAPLNITSIRDALFFLQKLYFIKRGIRKGYDIILLDQGLMQYIWSIVIPGRPPPDSDLIRLLKSFSDDMPQLIVVFDVDIDTAIKRIRARSTTKSYFDRITPDQAGALLTKHEGYVEKIVKCVAQLNGASCLKVNGNDDPRENVISIVRFIDEIWRSRINRASGI